MGVRLSIVRPAFADLELDSLRAVFLQRGEIRIGVTTNAAIAKGFVDRGERASNVEGMTNAIEAARGADGVAGDRPILHGEQHSPAAVNPPVGFDVRPVQAVPAKGLSVGTFVAGTISGTMLTGIVALAFHATQPPTTSPQALLAALPPVVAAAPPPAILAPSSVGAPADGPSTAPPVATASPSPADDPSAGAQGNSLSTVKKGRSAPRHVVPHKAKETGGGGSNLGASCGTTPS